MHIPQDLQQFNDAPALFIVCGTQEAKIYDAREGAIAELGALHLEKPDFTDHEGRSSRHGYAEGTIAGGVEETDQPQRRKEFTKALVEHLTAMTAGRAYDLVYLFVPEHAHNEVRAALPHDLQPKLSKEIHGNFCEAHPHDLVRKVMAE